MSERPEHPGSMSELSTVERLCWNLLADLVFEDSYALWEAILSTAPDLSELPRKDARALSAEAVIALIERGWAYLFRLGGLDPNVAFKKRELQLTLEEARSQVAQILTTGEPNGDIWIAPTELGTAVAKDPPSPVRELWGWTS